MNEPVLRYIEKNRELLAGQSNGAILEEYEDSLYEQLDELWYGMTAEEMCEVDRIFEITMKGHERCLAG